MKTTIAMAIMLLTVGLLGIQAQERQGPPPPPNFKQLQADLNLTDAQLMALEKLEIKYQKERGNAKKENNGAKGSKDQVREAHKEELQKILTKEQMEKLKVLMEEQRGQRKQPPHKK